MKILINSIYTCVLLLLLLLIVSLFIIKLSCILDPELHPAAVFTSIVRYNIYISVVIFVSQDGSCAVLSGMCVEPIVL